MRNHFVRFRRRHRALLAAALTAALSAYQASPVRAAQPTVPNTGSSYVDQKLAEAQKAIESGNGVMAAIHLKNALRVAPQNAKVRVQLGLILLEIGDASGAEHEIRQARQEGAPPELVLPALFRVMLARGEAQPLLDQFADPGNSATSIAAETLKARALALQSTGKPAQAVDAIDRSLKLSRNMEALLVRARLAFLQGDIRTAKSGVEEVLGKSPDNAEAIVFKIALLRLTKENAAALTLASQYSAKFPDNLQVRFARIETLLSQDQDQSAKAEVDAILAKRPNDARAVYFRAFLLARAGDFKTALATAITLPAEFLETSPSETFIVANIAESAGRTDTAAAVLSHLLAKQPDNIAARVRLATIRLDQNASNSALQILEPLKESSDPTIVKLLARIYTDLDRKADAAKVLKRLDAANNASANAQDAGAGSRPERIAQQIRRLSPLVAKEPTNASVVLPFIGALIQAKRLPEALAAADRLGVDPAQRVSAAIYRGEILLLQNDSPGAKAAFDKAVALEPKNKKALLSRASLLTALADYEGANRDLHAALSIDPKDTSVLLRLAQISARQGKDAEVRATLAKAVSLDPRGAAPRLALISYLAGQRQFQEALKASDALLRLEPNNAQGLSLRGQIQLALGQKKEALESFRQWVSLDPKAAAAQLMLGKALFSTGDRRGAEVAFENAAKSSPASLEVKGAQISLQFAQGKADAAIALAESFQRANPGPGADLLLADALIQSKQAGRAAGVLAKSLASRPSVPVLTRLVRLRLDSGQKKQAETLLSGWLEKHPSDVAVRSELGEFLIREKDFAKATILYEKIVAQDSNNALALNNLAWLIQDRDPQRALSMLARAAKIAPNSADVADTLGWLSLRQKDTRTGLRLLQRAHALRPDDGEITYHLAVALDAGGDRNGAQKLLNALLGTGIKFEDLAAARKLSSDWR
ncbi:MAG TPA: XrtA/PEP-CTERM system TPR-repeat protein PrsT [Rhizomicrobium sp.]|nr:XrtA/PEP-CTERM system TPR-repeat protein PrsT [Rhizomicrobium sp.]